MDSPRYRTLAAHLKQRFGERVQKIPLDAGFSCPNRDGTFSTTGCAFCNPKGSGSGLAEAGWSLPQQWEYWKPRLARKYKARLFLGYLQSFSNTHGPVSRLARVLGSLEGLEGCVGLCLGTRPDCLDEEKLKCIAARPFQETWLELGLQSAHDRTLERINRGHDAACFAQAVRAAADRELQVCAHVVAGLPGEGLDDFLETIRFLNRLPVQGIKIHNLYVCRDTALGELWASGGYRPLRLEEYVEHAARAVALLREDVVVHRINGDPAPGELLAPAWAADKGAVLSAVRRELEARDVVQGQEARSS
jgi:hypothetical protein